MLIVANIERCPKFLEYFLHALICSKKRHVGKSSSWVIITAPHGDWTLTYFYGCHDNGALKTTLSVLLDSSNPYISGAFLQSVATNGALNVLHYPGSVLVFQIEFFDWLKVNKEKRYFSFGAFPIDLVLSQLNYWHY